MAVAPHSILEQAGLASGLLSQRQIDRAWHAMVDPLKSGERSLHELSDAVLCEHLIELGYLNRWQAEQLCQGRTKFTLGPYKILDAIGHGGMGYVFKGEHVLLGRIEAIKVLPKSQMDPASIDAFCREIRAQAALDHPNLVRLSFADKEGDTYFLVTEFIPGSDLRRLVKFHGPLTEPQAAVVIAQAAGALAYAHDRGLVHRDVKPGNLLVTPAGRTKLTDLGLASFSSDAGAATSAGSKHIVGTPDFIAPEAIVAPSDVRRSSDIYSLGCTLYYAVTGKVPFPGGTTRDKLRRHLEEAPITPARFNADLDESLVDLVAEMMHKRVEERVASAAEVVARLRPWTDAADDNTWRQIGQYATAPGQRSIPGATLAETIAVSADDVETEDSAMSVGQKSPPVHGTIVAPAPPPPPSSASLPQMAAPEEPAAPAPPFEIAGLGAGPVMLITAAVMAALVAVALVVTDF